MSTPAALLPVLARIRLAVFDVDGVFTDGRLHYGQRSPSLGEGIGEVAKVFHVRDGHGIKRLRAGGVEVAVISGRSSPIVAARMAELGVAHVHQGSDDKLPVLEALLARLGVPAEACCYCGDDEPDLAPMRAVALSVAPADAHPDVRAVADWVLAAPGGHGAVRELADGLLAARAAPGGRA
jgi:3-deoxy-D-manno-octulosonate 8-phosphate phosphatase (KDO 8-P phosphatase)